MSRLLFGVMAYHVPASEDDEGQVAHLAAGAALTLGPLKIDLQLCWGLAGFVVIERRGRHFSARVRIGPVFLRGVFCTACWLEG